MAVFAALDDFDDRVCRGLQRDIFLVWKRVISQPVFWLLSAGRTESVNLGALIISVVLGEVVQEKRESEAEDSEQDGCESGWIISRQKNIFLLPEFGIFCLDSKTIAGFGL